MYKTSYLFYFYLDFQVWKQTFENETSSQFVKGTGNKFIKEKEDCFTTTTAIGVANNVRTVLARSGQSYKVHQNKEPTVLLPWWLPYLSTMEEKFV